MSAARAAAWTLATGAAFGAGVLAYSLAEAHMFTLRHARVPVLPSGQDPLLVLHLSDLHMTPRQRDKRDWVTGLSQLQPDLVVATGDFLSHRDAVGSVITALGPLLDLPGAFVLGSNDYYSPSVNNPLRYLLAPSKVPEREPDLPTAELTAAMVGCGWADLNNRREVIKTADRVIDARGVDDPHISRDRYDDVAGPFDPAADLKLAVTHAPYARVLDAMAADGADLIMAGHTHGGQVCVPGYGALVTNCDLDTERVKGLHHHRNAWLHVSAGLGTNPHTPVRLACKPEATLLMLVARS